MKLQQGQVWKKEGEFLRIIRLERLEVKYKSTTSLATKKGIVVLVSKKQFCRLLKDATLVPPVVETSAAPAS